MAFVTRCPNCLSTYRVVDDQLRLAGGWVRCGRCSEMFNAPQARVDLEEPTAAREPGAQAQEPSAVPPGAVPRQAENPRRDAPAAGLPPSVAHPAGPPPAPAMARPAPLPDRRSVASAAAPSPSPPAAPALPSLDSDDLARGRLLLGADGHWRRWRSPRLATRRAAGPWLWGSVAAIAAAVLGVQAVVAWHDQLAQSMPGLKPAVEVVCVMAECRVEAARQLQALSVESSELLQLGGTVYQVTLVLRSRAEQELAVPAIDLKLTNTRQEVVIRRVLRFSDFGLRSGSIGPRQELTLQAALNTGERQIAGYNIELFYP